MSHTVYGNQVQVIDVTFTTNGSGVATETVYVDGAVCGFVFKMDTGTNGIQWVQFTDTDSVITPPLTEYRLRAAPHPLYGYYTLTITGSASASGRLKLYVR